MDNEPNDSITEEVVFNKERDEETHNQLHIILDVMIRNHIPRKKERF